MTKQKDKKKKLNPKIKQEVSQFVKDLWNK
jgi:hypothetical protein